MKWSGTPANRLCCRFPTIAKRLGSSRKLFPHAAGADSFQTNGLRIDAEWCRFFLENRVNVGLSIDGPARMHDAQRRTRSGRGTHAQAMRAVTLLRRHNVLFSVIAVLTRAALTEPDELFDFFANLDAAAVGFNIEETEGQHVSATLAVPELASLYLSFLRRFAQRNEEGSLRIREVANMRRAILQTVEVPFSVEATPLGIVSVDVSGEMATFSPELLGVERAGHGRFRFGNVMTVSLDEMMESPEFLDVADEIARRVEACRATCDYFSLCGGGAPANKYHENGSFATTETLHCATRIKAAAVVVLEQLEGRQSAAPRITATWNAVRNLSRAVLAVSWSSVNGRRFQTLDCDIGDF